jgi:hypothetical protein
MADRPLLFLPLRGTAPRKNKGGDGDRVFPASRAAQEARLLDRIENLEEEFERRQAAFQADPENSSPETILVLELATSVTNFANAARRVGLTLLGEWDEDDVDAASLGFQVFNTKRVLKAQQQSTAHVYLTAVNLGTVTEFRRLFTVWREEGAWPTGTTPWRDLFNCILDLRPWGPEDRLRDSGLQQDWQEAIDAGLTTVQFEAEFWFKPQSADARQEVTARFRRILERVGGRVKHASVIDAIGFHGVLGELPVAAIGNVENLAQLEFVRFDEILEFHRVTQAAEPRTEEGADLPVPVEPTGTADGEPIIAMIDGVPMQNHPDLSGYLQVNDTDELEAQVPANERWHGSQMASLIVNGDLTEAVNKLKRPVVVRPVLVSEASYRGIVEKFPADRLAIDTFHRAVLDVVALAEQRSARERIHVINVSLGDRDRMFLRRMSPWARLIDWLSFRHRVLFIVSAGNCTRPLRLAVSEPDLRSATPETLQTLALDAMYVDRRNRRLLAPGESINAITVGAARGEGSGLGSQQYEPIVLADLAAIYSAFGNGFRNTLKPDLLAPGGRQSFRLPVMGGGDNSVSLEALGGSGPPGLLAGAPGSIIHGPRRSHTRGTSAAAALTTRLAAQIFDALDEIQGIENLSGDHVSVVLKALIAHTANWGEAAEKEWEKLLTRHGITAAKMKDSIARFLGHGCIRPARALGCTDERVTAVGYADIGDGDGHIYEFPWPSALRARTDERRFTITLASLVPTTPHKFLYRGADIWAAKPGELTMVGLGSGDRDSHAVQRGILQHISYSGKRASDFSDGATVRIQVNCRADSMMAEQVRNIPYALAVTLEVPEASGIKIYEQVQIAIRAQARVSVCS